MRNQFVKSLIGLAAAVLLAAPWSFAGWRGSHKSGDRSTHVTLSTAEELGNGPVLPAGTYRMEVPDNATKPEVAFYKDGKLVAQAQAQVVTSTNKNPYTEVDSRKAGSQQIITAIRPVGWTESLVFKKSNSSSTKSAS